MKRGIAESSQPSVVDDTHETVSEFLLKISQEQAMHPDPADHRAVETTQTIINHFFPGGLKNCQYFTYGNPGVRVYPRGVQAEVEADERIPFGQKIHGKKEPVLDGNPR